MLITGSNPGLVKSLRAIAFTQEEYKLLGHGTKWFSLSLHDVIRPGRFPEVANGNPFMDSIAEIGRMFTLIYCPFSWPREGTTAPTNSIVRLNRHTMEAATGRIGWIGTLLGPPWMPEEYLLLYRTIPAITQAIDFLAQKEVWKRMKTRLSRRVPTIGAAIADIYERALTTMSTGSPQRDVIFRPATDLFRYIPAWRYREVDLTGFKNSMRVMSEETPIQKRKLLQKIISSAVSKFETTQ